MTPLEILALLCAAIGIVGSIVPGLPGPPISWLGLLLCYFAGTRGECDSMSTGFLLVWLGITTLVTLLDYIVPGWFAKYTGGHKEASWGAIIGLFAGMFLTPVGVLAGALIGAFIGEYVFARQNAVDSVKAALGAFLGFIFGTGVKLIASGVMMFYIFKFVF
ncbi:MAG: DUF456 domain-containing protein [Bacteroidales bacterium]|nr:DUF456 domain-containing protein [Bacteroidales bacterium]